MWTKALAGALAALTLACCATEEGPPTDRLPPELHRCAPYARLQNALEFCVYKQASNLPSPEDVDRVCPLAGALEAECRRAWVLSRASPALGFSTEALLTACGEDPDCAFELLDTRPEADVLRQLERCASSAGRFASDCAVHALERWVTYNPGESEVARVAARQTAFPEKVGYALGMARGCLGRGACEGEAVVANACADTVRKLQAGELQCPRPTLNPGFQRRGP